MAGRKNFVAGEILTAADVNSFLMDQSVMVFDDSAARGSAIPTPSEGMVTYRKDLGGAAGLEVYDGAGFAPVSGILQVVSATKSNTFSTSLAPGNFSDVTGLEATITPTSTSSKILVLASFVGASNGGGIQGSSAFRFMRDSTAIGIGDADGSRSRITSRAIVISANDTQMSNINGNFLDSPNTVSPVTYKIQIANVLETGSTVTVYVNRNDSNGTSASNGRTISTITLMEVAG